VGGRTGIRDSGLCPLGCSGWYARATGTSLANADSNARHSSASGAISLTGGNPDSENAGFMSSVTSREREGVMSSVSAAGAPAAHEAPLTLERHGIDRLA
jgi:hypothetical protein